MSDGLTTVKRCSRCKNELELDAFTRDASRADGRDASCRSCKAEKRQTIPEDRARGYRRNYYLANKPKWQEYAEARRVDPEKREIDLRRQRVYRQRLMLKRMSWDADLYDRLFDAQGGRCAICKTEAEEGFFLAIDHNHETGQVRGLLCRPCNLVIGNACDDPIRLLAAVDYLTIS